MQEITQLTVSQFLAEHILKSQKDRLAKLIEIKAPQVMLDNMQKSIKFLEEGGTGYAVRKGDSDCLGWIVISSTVKTGNGGKKFREITCEEGKVNYFPQASYGRFVSKSIIK